MNMFSLFFKGFAMGAANVIPGVSGGTVAFITGIYQRLINAIKAFDVEALKMLKGRNFSGFAKHVDLKFLMILGFGVVISIVTLAKVLGYGFEEYPQQVSALFFGLIAASVWSVFKMVKQWSAISVIALALGCATAVSMVFLPQASENTGFVYLMLCGAVAMSSMIIPGVSGSFVLLLLGNYKLIMLDSVNDLRAMKLAESMPIIFPVGLGAILGLAFLSRLLSWLFKKYHDVAVASITGFVAGSLAIIWPWKEAGTIVTKEDGTTKVLSYERYFPEMNGDAFVICGIILLGALLMIAVEKFGAIKSKS